MADKNSGTWRIQLLEGQWILGTGSQTSKGIPGCIIKGILKKNKCHVLIFINASTLYIHIESVIHSIIL